MTDEPDRRPASDAEMRLAVILNGQQHSQLAEQELAVRAGHARLAVAFASIGSDSLAGWMQEVVDLVDVFAVQPGNPVCEGTYDPHRVIFILCKMMAILAADELRGTYPLVEFLQAAGAGIAAATS